MYGRTSLCDLANGAENVNIESDDSLETIQDATIVGTKDFNMHYSCIHCSARLAVVENKTTRCPKCAVLQQTSALKFEVNINILFKTTGNKNVMIKVFTDNILRLLKLIGHDDNTDNSNAEVALLSNERKFNITFTSKRKYLTDITVDEPVDSPSCSRMTFSVHRSE